jgi:hypothetical protein
VLSYELIDLALCSVIATALGAPVWPFLAKTPKTQAHAAPQFCSRSVSTGVQADCFLIRNQMLDDPEDWIRGRHTAAPNGACGFGVFA